MDPIGDADAIRLALHQHVNVLIDEYDNFANEVLVSRQKGEGRYQELVGGEGVIKTLFKAIKDAAEGHGLDRVFITGVSPVVLADITSDSMPASHHFLNGLTACWMRLHMPSIGSGTSGPYANSGHTHASQVDLAKKLNPAPSDPLPPI